MAILLPQLLKYCHYISINTMLNLTFLKKKNREERREWKNKEVSLLACLALVHSLYIFCQRLTHSLLVAYYWFCIDHERKLWEQIICFLMTEKFWTKIFIVVNIIWNSKFSVYKQGFTEAQKQSFIQILSTVAFPLWEQRWQVRTKTICSVEFKTFNRP